MHTPIYEHLVRLEQADNRQVLLNVFSDIVQYANQRNLNSDEYYSVITHVITKLEPKTAGLLTECELKSAIEGILLNTPLPIETFKQLVRFINNRLQCPFKFSKILYSIEFIMQQFGSEILMPPFSSIKETMGFREKFCAEAEDLSRVLSSFSDRIFNFIGTISNESKKFSDVSIIVLKFENNLAKALLSLLTSYKSEDECRFFSFSLILADYLNINVEFVEDLFSKIFDEEINLHTLSTILFNKQLDARKRERLLYALFNWTKNTSQLTVIFGSHLANDKRLRNYIVRKFFLLPFPQAKRMAILQKSVDFSKYLLSTNLLSFTEVFIELLEIFVDQSRFVEFTTIEHQFNVACIIIKIAKEIDPDDFDTSFKDNVFKLTTEMVPELLKIPVRSRRQVGLFVAETLLKLLKCSQTELKFDYVDDDLMEELRSYSIFKESPVEEKVSQKQKLSIKHEKIIANYDFRTSALDSDDEDESDERVLNESDATCTFEDQPVYMQNCIEYLGDKGNHSKTLAALKTIPKLVRKDPSILIDYAEPLIQRVLFLEDTYKILEFKEMKRNILSLTISHRPELVSYISDILFSKRCPMSIRYFILDVIKEAAENLATSYNLVNQADEKKTIANKLSSIIEQNVKRPKVLQSNQKENQTLMTKKFNKVAVQFILPLTDISINHGAHLDLLDTDNGLLVQILNVISHLLRLAKNAPGLVTIVSAILPMIHRVRISKHVSILISCQLCYVSILEALPKETIVSTFHPELYDIIHWVTSSIESKNQKNDEIFTNSNFLLLKQLSEILA